MVGSFEVFDVGDPSEIEQIRERLSVVATTTAKCPHWEYGSELAELRRLYEKGKLAQWNASVDLDWSTPVR
jgi:hypothetical protein